jgi:hypothetical protein
MIQYKQILDRLATSHQIIKSRHPKKQNEEKELDMTAIQILEKLGANASFNPSHLSEEDKSGIEQTLSDSKPFTAIQTHIPPDDEEAPDEEKEKDSEKET